MYCLDTHHSASNYGEPLIIIPIHVNINIKLSNKNWQDKCKNMTDNKDNIKVATACDVAPWTVTCCKCPHK